MRKSQILVFLLFSLLLSLVSLSFRQIQQAQDEQAMIHNPAPGSAVQGLQQVIGSANVDGFTSYQLEFASQATASTSWFPIHQQTTPVDNNILGEWDTSVLTDGDYLLRLTVFRQSGDPATYTVEGIRIRNYSPIETDTPAPTNNNTLPTKPPTSTPPPTPTSIPIASPTPPPVNPISTGSDQIQHAAIVGAILGILGALILMIYVGYRQKS